MKHFFSPGYDIRFVKLFIKHIMEKKLHGLKRFIQKVGIKTHRMMNPIYSSHPSQSEREACLILKNLLKDPSTEILTSPLSGKFYLRSSDKQILIVFGNGQISIVNHVYGYNVPVTQKSEKMLTDKFLEEIEVRRQRMEDEYSSNIKHSLKNIIENLKINDESKKVQQ